jgi:hypothetical protein
MLVGKALVSLWRPSEIYLIEFTCPHCRRVIHDLLESAIQSQAAREFVCYSRARERGGRQFVDRHANVSLCCGGADKENLITTYGTSKRLTHSFEFIRFTNSAAMRHAGHFAVPRLSERVEGPGE